MKNSLKILLLTSTMISSTALADNISPNAFSQDDYVRQLQAKYKSNTQRWFWSVSAQATQDNTPTNRFTNYSHVQLQSVDFTNTVFSRIPLLGPSIEKSLDRAINRRLQRTAEFVATSDKYDRIMRELEFYQAMSIATQMDLTSIQADIEDSLYYYKDELNHFRDRYNNRVLPRYETLTPINHTAFNDVNSVLSYFAYARHLPGMRIRGEVGYKKENFEWRIGGQKHKANESVFSNERQERQSVYSTMDWDISAHFNYMNYYIDEDMQNFLGVKDLNHERKTEYHRLSYRFNDETALYLGHGINTDDVYGKAKYDHVGVQSCKDLIERLKLCGNIRYERADIQQNLLHDMNGQHSGVGATLNLDYRF